MKEKLALLTADIRDDLRSILRLKEEYVFFLSSINTNEPDLYQRMVIGYLLHNFYNICENIFVNIARTFENHIDPQTWHKSALKRMKLEIEGIRPAVISDSLYVLLDDFRAFRHVFRHIYSSNLDWSKEKIVADKFLSVLEKFNTEINTFIAFLKALEK